MTERDLANALVSEPIKIFQPDLTHNMSYSRPSNWSSFEGHRFKAQNTESICRKCNCKLILVCYWWFCNFGQNEVNHQNVKGQGHDQTMCSKKTEAPRTTSRRILSSLTLLVTALIIVQTSDFTHIFCFSFIPIMHWPLIRSAVTLKLNYIVWIGLVV